MKKVLLLPADARQAVCLGRTKFEELARRGEFEVVWIDGARRITAASVEAFVERHRTDRLEAVSLNFVAANADLERAATAERLAVSAQSPPISFGDGVHPGDDQGHHPGDACHRRDDNR